MKSIASIVPLRDTTAWPGYREARWIPRRYGVCAGEALQYDDTRTRWVWADHPSAAVDEVFAGGQRASNWTWRNVADATGRPVTMIEFATPVPEGQGVVARGRGYLHPVRGVLIENAADVIWDILANVAGLPLPAARLAAFRQQSVDLPVGGSFEEPARGYEIARSICSSIGAICSPDMTGFARLWPEFDGPAVTTIGPGDIEVSAQADLDDIVTDLTLRYAWQAGTPRGAVQYVVARAPAAGPRPAVVDAPWVSSSRVASQVCARLLRLRARPQYVVSVRGFRGDLRVGDAVDLTHPLLPVTGVHMAQSREYEIGDAGERTSITLRAPAGAVPAIKLVRNTNASEALPQLEISASAAASEFVVTLVDDETGLPLAGADCTLDGLITRRADNAGRVEFPSRYATPGQHTIVAVAPGRDPVTLILTVT